MDLSELLQDPSLRSDEPSPQDAAPATSRTHELAGQLGAEVAEPLSAALARIDAALAAGKLDRATVKALRADIERARRSAMIGQQVHRLASDEARPAREKIELGHFLREALLQRGRDASASGIEVRQVIKPAQVEADAPLLFSLLQAVLDWGLEHALTAIEFRLDVKTWPVHAVLSCRFSHHPADQVDEERHAASNGHVATTLDTMSWRLVQQAAQSMGLLLSREDTPTTTLMSLEFPQTVNQLQLGAATNDGNALALGPDFDADPTLSQVLVVASRREVRNQVREALRGMDLMTDYATSLDEAREHSAHSPPQAVIYELALAGEAFEDWRRELLAESPHTAFIQIAEEGRALEISMQDGREITRVGRDAVTEALPSVLGFELTRL
jgi:hypothetical protein